MLRELDMNEMEMVAGGCPPCAAAALAVLGVAGRGALVGGGVVLIAELTDDNPGVRGSNIVIGASATAGAAVVGIFGATATIVGGIGFGALGGASISANNSIISTRANFSTGGGSRIRSEDNSGSNVYIDDPYED